MNSALVIIALIAILALALGLAARRGMRMTLEQWTVGGRGFGAPQHNRRIPNALSLA